MKNIRKIIFWSVFAVIVFSLAAAGFQFYSYVSFKNSLPTDVGNMWVEYYEDGSISVSGRTLEDEMYTVFIPSLEMFDEPYSYMMNWEEILPDDIDICILPSADIVYFQKFLDFTDSFNVKEIKAPKWADKSVTDALKHSSTRFLTMEYGKNTRFLVGECGFECLAKADTPSFYVTHGENHFVISKDKAVSGFLFTKLKADLSFMNDKPFQISRILTDYCVLTDVREDIDMPAQYSDKATQVTYADSGWILYTLSDGMDICSDFDFLSTGSLGVVK